MDATRMNKSVNMKMQSTLFTKEELANIFVFAGSHYSLKFYPNGEIVFKDDNGYAVEKFSNYQQFLEWTNQFS